MKNFEWYDKELYKILDGLIDNWPEQNDLENVVTIDLFTMSAESLQDQVVRAMNVQQGEKRRISYAWRLCHQFHYNAHLQHQYADYLMFSIIALTFLATLVSVFYAYFTSANVPPISAGTKNCCPISHQSKCFLIFLLFQLFMFLVSQDVLVKLNIVLPVGVTVLRGVYAYLDPLVKYWSLKYAAIRTESEIYIYRAKVGQYAHKTVEMNGVKKTESSGSSEAVVDDASTKAQNFNKPSSNNEKYDVGEAAQHQQESNDLPRKKFSETLKTIVESVNERHTLLYPRMGLSLSIDMHPMKEVAKRLAAHKKSQDFLTMQVEGPERFDMWSRIKGIFQSTRVWADAEDVEKDKIVLKNVDTMEDDGK